MTYVKTLLLLLSDGEFRTTKEMMEQTGLTRVNVEGTIKYLVDRKMACAVPVSYGLTDLGAIGAKAQPPDLRTAEEKRAAHKAAQKRYRERQRAQGISKPRKGRNARPRVEYVPTPKPSRVKAFIPPPPLLHQTLAAQALANRPLLQVFWNAAA